MKRGLCMLVVVALGLVFLAGCSGNTLATQPLSFKTAPWTDGEVSTYDVLGKDGKQAGTATWTWHQVQNGWTQAYELNMAGRLDRGTVVLGKDLLPAMSWRELSGLRFDTTYGPDKATIRTTATDGKVTGKDVTRPADGLDNDQSLQVQRALPLANGYATRYTDIIPTSGQSAPIRVSVTGVETITVPAGTFPSWHISMDYGAAGSHDAWYCQAAPNLLIRYRNRSSGAVFDLRAWQPGAGAGAQGTPGPAVAAAAAAATSAPGAAPDTQTRTPGAQTAGNAPVPLNVPFLLAALLIQYPLMLAFPVLVGWWIRRRYGPGWGIFGAGALTFIASQLAHLPFNWAIGLIGGGRGVALWPLPALALAAGLSAGLFEEGARWIVLTFFLKRARGWRAALQFGAGHEAAESIIFGLLALASLVSMLILRSTGPAALGLSGATADQARAAAAAYWSTPWYMTVVAGMERVASVAAQIAFAVLVMRAVTRRQPLYLLAAIGAHALVDAWAVWAGSRFGTFAVEGGVFVVAVLLAGLIFWLREEPIPAPATVDDPGATTLPTAESFVPRELSAEELARRANESQYERPA